METMHSLLRRQLKRHLGDVTRVPAEWLDFINSVNEAYQGFDADRVMLEHSLELSSQELIEANSEMRAVFRAIPDLVFRVSKDGVILNVKSGSTGDLMMERHALIGKRLQDIPLNHVSRQFAAAILRVNTEQTAASFEYSAALQGRESHFEARLVPLPDGQIVVIIQNITERKQSLRLLGAAVEQAMESIMILGAELDVDGPRILFANPSFTSMTGYSMTEAVDKFPALLRGREPESEILRGLRESMGRGEAFAGETIMHRKDGTEFDVELQLTPIRDTGGKITHFVGMFRDITARKKAEAELAYERNLFNILMDQSPTRIYFKDLESKFLRVSYSKLHRHFTDEVKRYQSEHPDQSLPEHLASEERFAGYLLGKTDFDFLAEVCAQGSHQQEQEIIRTGTPIVGLEAKEEWPDGRVTWARTSKLPFRDKEGRVIGTFGISEDITARKLIEAEREQLIKDLQSAQASVKSLSGLLPICAGCKKIRDDSGYWKQVESYIADHSEATFTHSLCPECVKKFYPWMEDAARSRSK